MPTIESILRAQNTELRDLLKRLLVAGVNWDFGSDLKDDVQEMLDRHDYDNAHTERGTMTDETKRRIREALEGEYGRATDNAHRFRAAFRGMDTQALAKQYGESGSTRGELLMRAEQEERAALAALKEFDPSWTPPQAFGR